MSAPIDNPSKRKSALLEGMRALTNLPAKTIFYGSALLAIAALPGAELPGILGTLATGLGIEALGNILGEIVAGKDVSGKRIREQVQLAIQESGIEQRLTSDEFQRTIARLVRQQNLLKYVVQNGDYKLAALLSEQFTQYSGIMDELKDDVIVIRNQLETLATRQQSDQIAEQLHKISDQLKVGLQHLPQTPEIQPAQTSKPGQLTPLGIFLASPNNMKEERDCLDKVIQEFNQPGGFAEQYGLTLQLLRWEETVFGMGRPEDVILDQIPVEQWGIFVGVLWTRFGTPTDGIDPETGKQYGSGTEEEFRLAYRAWRETGRPHILFYHRDAPPASLKDINPEQLMQVNAFLKEFETRGAYRGLYAIYQQPLDFERRVRQDLTRLIPRIVQPKPYASQKPSSPKLECEVLVGPYSSWLQRTHSVLDIRGLQIKGQFPRVALDRVYIALKGGQSNPDERNESRILLDAELEDFDEHLLWSKPDENNQRMRRWHLLAYSPKMPSLVERDRPSVFGEREIEKLNLAEAFLRYRWLVILGDPGSGKTTLARWLTLHLAQALQAKTPNVSVPAHHVDPEAATIASPINLGKTRLPVLMRVSDYAEARQKNPNLLLCDYLGYHPWLGEEPTFGEDHPQRGELIPKDQLNTLIKNHLRRRQAVVILDGMDEITRGVERNEIVHAIEAFIQDWITTPDGLSPFDSTERPWHLSRSHQNMERDGGNQIIITSRIAGYHASPLSGHLTHFTIEPMTEPAIERFCEAWSQAVHQLLARPGESQMEIEQRARREAEALKNAVLDPNRPGVTEMATNPLLLTILALVHHNTQAKLPEQRFRLYQIAVENLVDVWRSGCGLTEDEVVNVLSPVAAHIHSNYASGLIPEPELRGLITQNLALYRGIDPDHLPRDFQNTVEKFLETVREQVGILAARGEYLYGFLHLTFQEYLAARHLVHDPPQTLERIREKISDPRWREPILLALGFAMWHWDVIARERFLQTLLDAPDPLSDLIPHNALLIAAAMPEFVYKPTRIVGEVTHRLLMAYADRQGSGRFNALQIQIETTLARLRRPDTARSVDQVLIEALNAQQPDAQMAAAALVAKNDWHTASIGEVLLQALPGDLESWEWPLTRALKTLAAKNPGMLPARRLPFRQALCGDAGLVGFIRGDFLWKRLITLVCGGMDAENQFNPQAIYKEPHNAKIYLKALRARMSSTALIDLLWSVWKQPGNTPDAAAEAILGLIALGENVEPALTDAQAKPSHAARAQAALGRLINTAESGNLKTQIERVLTACITGMAKYPDLLPEALRAAAQIGDEYARARALTGLAPHLPPDLQEQALPEALRAAAQIGDESARAEALTGLAPHLIEQPGLWRPFWARTYRDFLEAAPYIQAQRLLDRLAPAFPWDLLEDLPQRQVALRKIVAGGKSHGLPLNETAAQAVDHLLKSKDIHSASTILALLVDPEKEALPQITAWMENPDPKVRAQAARLLAHDGRLSPVNLQALVPLLQDGEDLVRYRTAETLHARYQNRRFKVSEIGTETVEILLQLHTKFKHDPRVSTILSWTLNQILHDDPEAIRLWVTSFTETVPDQSEDSTILDGIHQISEDAWQVMHGFLKDTVPNLQTSLLNSTYHLLQNNQIPQESLAALKGSLRELAGSENENVRQHALQCLGQIGQPDLADIQYLQGILPDCALDEAHLAVTALADIAVQVGWADRSRTIQWLRDQIQKADDPARASLLAGGWVRLNIKCVRDLPHFFPVEPLLDELADLLDNTPELILDALWFAGADDIPWCDYHEKIVKAAQKLLENQHSLAAHLVTELQNALSDQSEDKWPQRRIALAFAAALAEVAPATYANAADPSQLHKMFIRAIEDVHSFNARRFALTTLAHLRRVSVEAAAALRNAQRDVAKVQENAMQVVAHFRRVEGDLIPALAEGLYDQSAAAAYATGKLMAALGKSETTTQDQRQDILQALANAIRDPQSKRDVYVMEKDQIKYLGTLEQLLHQVLVSIAEGISSGSDSSITS